MTLPQIVKDCRKVPGWKITDMTAEAVAHMVLQSLIGDKLLAVTSRFILTPKGREYLEDPLKWQIDPKTTEKMEIRLFWNTIYEIFDRALARLRTKTLQRPK